MSRKVQGGASLLVGWRLGGKHVLIVGGGKEASGRVFFALDADAKVTIVCPASGLNDDVELRINNGELIHLDRNFHENDLDTADMVLSCIDQHEESRRIAVLCRARRIPVNCADIPELCDFYFFAQYRDGPVQFGISTNGCGPRIGARLRDLVVKALPEETAAAVDRIGRLRRKIRESDPDPNSSGRRMTWLSRLCDGYTFEEMAHLDDQDLLTVLESYERGDSEPPPAPTKKSQRRLVLVGAGPGDPGLLTVRALEAMRQADLVVSDQLIPSGITDLVPGKRLHLVQKKVQGRSDIAQNDANETCLAALNRGLDVVRLKGGDPFLFGRGGEEIAFFREHGFEADIVPGISSCIAAPESALIPVTHRGVADQLMVLSGRGEGGAYPNVPSYYEKRTTVVLMAVGRLEGLVELMLNSGYPNDVPAAVVEKGCWGKEVERVVQGTLETIYGKVLEAKVGAPALLIVGKAVSVLREDDPDSSLLIDNINKLDLD
ncbi:tetrapyrrole methylase [Powellomyces hirtus]|nr:tetrapyrrole methylase [Powellomyces hirtus]